MVRLRKFDAALALFVAMLLAPLFHSPAQPHAPPREGLEPYSTMSKDIIFDFNASRSQTKTIDIGFSLGPEELRGAADIVLGVPFRFRSYRVYPDTASGTVACATRILINGEELIAEHNTAQVLGGGPEQWHAGDEAGGYGFSTVYPDFPGVEHILEKLVPTETNDITATTTCTSNVKTTGPAFAVITLGPLEVWID